MDIICWSDYVCPFCYIGEARLLKAAAAEGIVVNLIPRAFELDPDAPNEPMTDAVTRLAHKYGMSMEEAAKGVAEMTALGRAEGLAFNMAETKCGNTFNAHRLMKLARAGQDAEIAKKVNRMLFDACFGQGLNLADRDVLLGVAAFAGLPEGETLAMLASERCAEEVRQDEVEAAALGIRAVPVFLLPNGGSIRGCVQPGEFREALKNASGSARGSQCGPDGCDIRGKT